jgi:hypothetical protein
MPINRRSIILLSATGTDMNKYSDEVKGDSYYGYTDGYHTVQVTYEQFIGRMRIQASLVLEPTSDDWFDIVPSETTGQRFNENGYIQYNADDPASKSEAYSFKGNFAWIRLYMDREHVGDGSTYDNSYGQVSRVVLSS